MQNNSASITVFNEDQDGIIDIVRIFDENGPERDYFISGPPAMIKLFREKLILHGVFSENIKTDDWE